MVDPPVVANIGEDAGQAGRVDALRVELGEPVRKRLRGIQRVQVTVRIREMPVQVPDEIAPSDHLADEALHRGERGVAPVVRLLGSRDHLPRVEQSQVHRCRQQRVGHPRIRRQHCVLVGAERSKAMGDEAVEQGQRLPACGGEASRAIAAEERHVSVPLPPIEVVPHLQVDLVLDRPFRLGDAERGRPRRWLSVVGVEVPPSADRLVILHQDVQAASGVAVEVLHEKAAATARLHPRVEDLHRRREAARGQHVDVAAPDCKPQCRRRRGVADAEGLSHVVQGLRVGIRAHVGALPAELGCAMAHRREDEMRLGTMEAASGEHAPRLDHEHRLIRSVQEVRA